MLKDIIKASFKEGYDLLEKFISDESNFEVIEQIVNKIAESFKSDGKVIICGNGGSMADAMHFAEELTGRFREDRKPLPAISLSDPTNITCVANDFGFNEVFSRGVEAFGKAGDIFIGLTTSGNSPNIIKALEKAEELKLSTILLLGKDGGKLKGKADYEIIINGKTSDRIQEIHMFILHTIVEGIERILFL
ncbi:MAG: D-sedoheptulose 7-phosphate isomerase [Candidatus Delongbacteria bacterium]|nr:D-sedoheptulose 7-phosphate isomerase [Candidatus Delongbacteria bacterium]MCG2761034.1 D-sedoheptulose 7-phosphate isomerase [Candidatus Delongbacteria bacterium]